MKNSNKINCLIVDDEPIAREVIQTHLAKIDDIEIIASSSNALEAFRIIRSHNIDLIFLDINMPEISGIAFAKSINKNIKIIFTTAYREYAVEGFELRAVDYLLKPISFERLLRSINIFFEEHHKNAMSDVVTEPVSNNAIFVRSERQMIKITYHDVRFIESFSDYIKIHAGEKIIVTRENISTLDSNLPQNQFLRIHRSFIISLRHIESFTKDFVVVQGKKLSISRSYKKRVSDRLESFKRDDNS